LAFGTASPVLGFDRDLKYTVNQLPAVWPDVQIEFRADSGFASLEVYDACERLWICDTIFLGMKSVLKRRSDDILAQAVAE
jgi:hypothetical protein